ncbi:MAG: DUF192 domain-containing protein [bacterium]|nr:DUF192 domain-containing protein [bacterium]
MYIVIDNRKIKLLYADTFIKKLIGLTFKKNINYCLRFRCNGIHTFFMKENIDVILTDKNNNILYTYKDLSKNRIIFPKKKVYYTYELPKNTIKKNIKKINIINKN